MVVTQMQAAVIPNICSCTIWLIKHRGTSVPVKQQNISKLLYVVGGEASGIPTGICSQMCVTACIFYRYTSSPTGILTLLSVFSVVLHFFLSFSPCLHFKFQMAVMSLGCSSSFVCCVCAEKESLRGPMQLLLTHLLKCCTSQGEIPINSVLDSCQIYWICVCVSICTCVTWASTQNDHPVIESVYHTNSSNWFTPRGYTVTIKTF